MTSLLAHAIRRAHAGCSAAATLANVVALFLAGSVLPSVALAFSDPLAFSDDVELGGGGGRFFTGSATDGYGCNVCHAGGIEPAVQLKGLPLAGYSPSTAYEIQIDWPDTIEHMGLAVEITDSTGLGAGTLRLPPENELPNEERCEPVEDGFMAAQLTELSELPEPSARTVINVPDCGAKRLRFLWTSPATASGTLRFSGGLVASDGEADAAGDGVTLFAHTLPDVRSTPLASKINGSCSATPGRSASKPRLMLACLTLLTLCLGLRRSRLC